jgi:hypothetical protein
LGQSRILKLPTKLFQVFCSLKLAVLVILSLAFSLGAGTFVESLNDTPSAQYWIYRSDWFHALLALLGVNIFCVAISRFPWTKKHIPFLLAHAGILILLAGSWITERAGIDGNLRISEGETASIVDLDTASLVLSEKGGTYSIPIPWLPPSVKFKPFTAADYHVPYDLKVDQFLSHSDPIVAFIPNIIDPRDLIPKKPASPALHFQLTGGPMGVSQDIWLWTGAPGWKELQAGPAHFSLEGDPSAPALVAKKPEPGKPGRPTIQFRVEKDGGISFSSLTSDGKKAEGRFKKERIVGQVIHPGWKGDVTLTLLDWVPDAVASTTYKPARVEYGPQAPTSAIHIVASQTVDVWLGLGDRAVLHLDNHDVEIGYFPRRVMLPFSIRLEKFTVDHDQGTLTPAAYSSRVSVLDGKGQKDVDISMNEPLAMGGYTLYQASYEDGSPRPVTSIFAVNRDPGRPWKYLGSALIVLGSIVLFYGRTKKAKPRATSKKAAVSEV